MTASKKVLIRIVVTDEDGDDSEITLSSAVEGFDTLWLCRNIVDAIVRILDDLEPPE